MRARLAPVLAATAAALACAVAVAAPERYEDRDLHWSVEVPAGWRVESPTELAARSSTAELAQRNRPYAYVAGFVPEGPIGPESPFVIAQWTPMDVRGLTWSDVERQLGATAASAGAEHVAPTIGSIAARLDLGKIAVDRARSRFVMRLALEAGETTRTGLSVGHLAWDGILHVNCYALDRDFERYRRTFEAMADSFRFAEGRAYAPPAAATDSAAPPDAAPAESGPKAWVFVVCGAVAVVALVGLLVLRRR